MRKYSKAQLNAISRSYTERDQKKAIEELRKKWHINFDEFKFLMDYKASPVRLLYDLNHDNKTALKRYNNYLKLPRLIMEEK